MKAMILAAGLGTRLWPLTEDRTKPAVPFLNKPLVAYAVEFVRRFGIRNIIVNLHHCPESVRDALGDGSAFDTSIQYSFESEILGTGGAIDKVRCLLEDDEFVVVNGKIVTDIDLGAAIDQHRRRDALATLVVLPNARRERFSTVDCDHTGAILGFGGYPKPLAPGETGQDVPAPLMFTGIQVLSPRVFEYVPRGVFSHTTTDVYPPAIRAGERVQAFVASGTWREMSTVERYLGESLACMRDRGENYVAGGGCEIASDAVVEQSVLWRDVRVESGAVVRRSVLGDGVVIPRGMHVEQSVVVRASLVHEIERGSVQGDNLVAPIGAVLD